MEMERAQKTTFANPSALYQEALTAKDFVEKGRKKIADILHAQKSEIVFTGGGTESNNLALFGLFEDFQRFDLKNSKCRTLGNKPHIITTKIEHPAILEVCREIERRGGQITYLPVDSDGLVSLKKIRESIKKNTILITIS